MQLPDDLESRIAELDVAAKMADDLHDHAFAATLREEVAYLRYRRDLDQTQKPASAGFVFSGPSK